MYDVVRCFSESNTIRIHVCMHNVTITKAAYGLSHSRYAFRIGIAIRSSKVD